MVRRLISMLTANVSGVHAAAYVLAISAICSQLLALIRDRLLAHTFGAGAELDIYYSAFRIQDFLFFSVASFVSLTVLIPILFEKIDKSREETKKFISSVFSIFFIAISAIGIVVAYFTPYIVSFIFPGILGKGYDTDLIFLTRILLLSPLILGLSNLLGSITQVYKKFFIYAISPLLYNIGIILGIIFFYPLYGISGLGYGVIMGAILHLLIQVPFIFSEGLFPKFTFVWNFKDIKRLISLSLPRTLALSLNHITLLVLFSLASLMNTGSISILSFSFNLQSVLVAVIGASYSVAAFPTLARHFFKKEQKEFIEHFTTALKHIIFWSFPALVLFIVLRAQIVRVILGSGAFSWDDTRLTAATLALFAISIVAQNISLLFIRAFYAAGDTKKPLIISLVSSFAVIVLAYFGLSLFSTNEVFRNFLEVLLRVEDLPGTIVLVLPLAYSIGSFLNVILFWIFFRRFFSPLSFAIGNTALHSLSSSVLVGLVTYQGLRYFGEVFNLDTLAGIFLQGALSGIIGIGFGILILFMLKNEEFFEIIKSLKRRIFKADVVQTDTII